MKWNLKLNDNTQVDMLMNEFNLTKLQAKLLLNRGIDTIEKAEKYLNGNAADLYDGALLKDMDIAIKILEDAINKQMQITIMGDFDCDGCNATALSLRAIKMLGGKVDYYIPDREKEGYGLNNNAIKTVYDRGTEIIVTVDNGISAKEQVDLAKELGMTVIITDHHDVPYVENEITKEKEYILPKADAVINPKRSDCIYPNKSLCGCAVAFKLFEQLVIKMNGDLDGFYDLLSLVAFATIGDVMDLVDENRILVKEGLIAANHGANTGMTALANVCNINEITSMNIAFSLTPCVNAAGRIDDIKKAVECLVTNNATKAKELAEILFSINKERKDLTLQFTKEAEEYIIKNNKDKNSIIFVYNSNIPEGLVGLVAGRIKEKYNKPVFVFTDGEEYLKASGRGVEGHPLSLFNGLQKTKDLWVKGGGHTLAAGVSIEKSLDKLKEFESAFIDYTNELIKNNPFEAFINIDEILDNPTEQTVAELELIEPVGKGNPAPILATNLLDIEEAKPIGDKTHISFRFSERRRGVAFGQTYKYYELDSPLSMKIAYCPTINEYSFKNEQGNLIEGRYVQMQIKDMNVENFIAKDKSMLISSFINSTKKK